MDISVEDLSCEDFTLRAGGAQLSARWLRPPRTVESDATLVFLHEALGSIAQWKDFPAQLCMKTGLPGLLYDRRGFGGSEPLVLPRPKNYLDIEAEGALPEVLEACGVANPVLIGHSDGGSIALLFAAAFPATPLACVTLAAHVFVEDITLAGIRQACQDWQTTDLRERLARRHGTKVDAVFSGWADTWLRRDFRDWSMVERLPRIVCPLLVLQGLDDAYGTAEQVDAIVKGVAGPAKPVLLDDCGHMAHRERGEETLDAVIAFLDPLLSAAHSPNSGRIGFPNRPD